MLYIYFCRLILDYKSNISVTVRYGKFGKYNEYDFVVDIWQMRRAKEPFCCVAAFSQAQYQQA